MEVDNLKIKWRDTAWVKVTNAQNVEKFFVEHMAHVVLRRRKQRNPNN